MSELKEFLQKLQVLSMPKILICIILEISCQINMLTTSKISKWQNFSFSWILQIIIVFIDFFELK